MIIEKVNQATLDKLDKLDCNKYLSYLRYSLGKEREKAMLNEKRRAIHMIEDRLRKLNETR